jgi:benzoyl-CoA reductase/2-hydroxyglutaryl-CoA dehydratase subunit BcrC/BadD/HgdB
VEALCEIPWKRNLQLHDLGAEVTPEGGTPAGLVLQFIREYKLDGVIMHSTRSCRAISFGQAHTRKRLQKELDVPVLAMESDMADPRTWSDALIKMQINAFIETLASKKKAPARV